MMKKLAFFALAMCGIVHAQFTPQIPSGTLLGNSSGKAAAPSPQTSITIPLRDTISIRDYVPAPASAPRNSADSNANTHLTVTSGSAVVNCSITCNFTSADVGDIIVIFSNDNSGGEFQSTILSYQSATQVTMAATSTINATNAYAFWGPDQTTGIAAAWNAATASNKCLYFPAGGYLYNGAGLSGWYQPCILGDQAYSSYIYITTGNYFISGNERWNACEINRIGMVGGAGAVRNLFTGADVGGGPMDFHEDFFYGYTHSAISFNSSDITYESIQRSTFYGLSSSGTIGVAIAGTDRGDISENHFLLNQFAVKLAFAGNASTITKNDFIQFQTEPTPGTYRRAKIWLVPSGSNSSAGTAIPRKSTVTFFRSGAKNCS